MIKLCLHLRGSPEEFQLEAADRHWWISCIQNDKAI